MTRPLADPRVVLPALVAAVCFGFRAVPQRSPDEPVAAHSVALPPLRGLTPRGQVDYDLDPERSSVRFLVRGGAGQLLADCARVEGALSLGPEPVDGALTLRLDLASLRLRDTPPPTVDVHHVLGVLGDLQLVRRALAAAGAGFTLTLSGSVPGGTAAVLYGQTGALCPPIPVVGVELYVAPPLFDLGGTVPVDAVGNASFPAPVPPGLVGQSFWLEWVVITPLPSIQLSNPVEITGAQP